MQRRENGLQDRLFSRANTAGDCSRSWTQNLFATPSGGRSQTSQPGSKPIISGVENTYSTFPNSACGMVGVVLFFKGTKSQRPGQTINDLRSDDGDLIFGRSVVLHQVKSHSSKEMGFDTFRHIFAFFRGCTYCRTRHETGR